MEAVLKHFWLVVGTVLCLTLHFFLHTRLVMDTCDMHSLCPLFLSSECLSMVFGVYVVLHHHCMALLLFTAVQLDHSPLYCL